MDASRAFLHRQDYKTINEGKEARNSLVHEAKLFLKTECLMYIEHIEQELRAWGGAMSTLEELKQIFQQQKIKNPPNC